jgi:5-methylcytosine-specific restriction endonuclease McrA
MRFKFPKYSNDWGITAKRCKKRDGERCTKCGRRGTKDNRLHSHHIISKSKGGPDTETNLRTLCEECHSLLHPHMRKKKGYQ